MQPFVPGIMHEQEDVLLDCKQAGLVGMLFDREYVGTVGIELKYINQIKQIRTYEYFGEGQ